MEHLESNGISDAELFIHAIPHFEGSPGVVIDEERALNSPCTGYKADGKEILVFSEEKNFVHWVLVGRLRLRLAKDIQNLKRPLRLQRVNIKMEISLSG